MDDLMMNVFIHPYRSPITGPISVCLPELLNLNDLCFCVYCFVNVIFCSSAACSILCIFLQFCFIYHCRLLYCSLIQCCLLCPGRRSTSPSTRPRSSGTRRSSSGWGRGCSSGSSVWIRRPSEPSWWWWRRRRSPTKRKVNVQTDYSVAGFSADENLVLN